MPSLASRSCLDLLGGYRQSRAGLRAVHSEKLVFRGVEDRDVYNITAPFAWGGETCLLGRVEARDTEHSEVLFFRLSRAEAWEPVPSVPAFASLQDPCATFIDGELVLGGVNFPVALPNGETGWRMEFYRGNATGRLRHFFTGPDKMKDIRLKQIADGRIAVLTRPQGVVGGRGKIGFTVVDSLDHLTKEIIEAAPLFEHLFSDCEWGGANEVHLLSNGLLGVLGHVACFDQREHRHYYAVVFSVNPETGEASELRLIAERDDFPPGPAKRADLVNVIFSGGLVRGSQGLATLYAGVSDAGAARLQLPDPFLDYERAGGATFSANQEKNAAGVL